MINRLVLQNFKCFERQEFSLGSLTLLTGLNGMGKSSVIQALLLIRQSVRAGMERDGLLLAGDYVHLGCAADALYDSARGDEPDTILIAFNFADGAQFSFAFDASDKSADVLSLKDGHFPQHHHSALLGRFGGHKPGTTIASDDLRTFHYLSAERLGPRDIHVTSAHHVDRLRDLGPDGGYAVAYLDGHASEKVADAMHRPEAASPQLISQVTAWMGEISPGVRISTSQYRELSRAALSISFSSGKATSRKLRPTGVGFGLSYTLPVVVALLSAKAHDLVFIENPEAHLHPRGQMAMGELMARATAAGVQVLCETHSDHVLNGVRLAVKQKLAKSDEVRLHYFSRTDDGERIVHKVDSPRVDANGRIDQWPEGFFDQWDVALEKLL